MSNLRIRTCENCGREIVLKPRGGRRRYCSDACRASAWRTRRAFTGTGTGTANQQALEEMLSSYVIPRSMAAVVCAARCLAASVDAQPYNPALWARYQQALAQLAPVVADKEDTELQGVLAEIGSYGPGGANYGRPNYNDVLNEEG